MADNENTGSNLVWAIALIIIVAIVAGTAFFGFKQLNRNTRHDVDVEINVPKR